MAKQDAPTKSRILIVDDEPDIAALLAFQLEDAGYETLVAHSGNEAWALVQTHPVTLVISDIRMADGSGLELLDRIHVRTPEMPVMLITGFADISDKQAMGRGARAVLMKPIDVQDLMQTIAALCPAPSSSLTGT